MAQQYEHECRAQRNVKAVARETITVASRRAENENRNFLYKKRGS